MQLNVSAAVGGWSPEHGVLSFAPAVIAFEVSATPASVFRPKSRNLSSRPSSRLTPAPAGNISGIFGAAFFGAAFAFGLGADFVGAAFALDVAFFVGVAFAFAPSPWPWAWLSPSPLPASCAHEPSRFKANKTAKKGLLLRTEHTVAILDNLAGDRGCGHRERGGEE